jgi:para-nitrobenzyl esterase
MRWLAVMVAMLLAVPAIAQTRVTTETGIVEGSDQGGVSAFLGIPFAADAGGANRWRAPQPAPRWQGVRQAKAFGPGCVQGVTPNRGAIGPWTWEYLHQGAVSEDCLQLNVWAPAGAQKAPVLVWIYGGGFTSGSTAVPLYDGAALAKRGIVVVSVNYRVGIYGFFTHPELTREAGTSGNYAILDQIAGLEWIRRNIAAFGGDSGAVTISGQSAGAASVHALIASPKAKGLFHRAIAQSGSGMRLGLPARGEAEAQGAKLGTLTGLRAMTPERLAEAARGQRFGLVHGTPELPDLDVAVSDVPILTGLTADEGSALSPEYRLTDAKGIRDALEQRYFAGASLFAPFYPAPDPETAGASARAMGRDRGIAAMLYWARARPAGSAPVYGYLWTWPEPGSKPEYRAFHSAELAYVFGSFAVTPERPFTATDRAISQRLGAYWANFVKTGDPNGSGLPAWPRIDSGRIMELGEQAAPRAPLDPKVQAAFDAYVAGGGRIGLF